MKTPLIDSAGNKFWYNENNQLNRDDGPAIERINGNKIWYQNGKIHRINEPAIKYGNGRKEWWNNNQLHRDGGPAIEFPNGDKIWFQNNKIHRNDGPAIEFANGTKKWYLKGIQYSESKFNNKQRSDVQDPNIVSIGNIKVFINKSRQRINNDHFSRN